MPDALTIKVVFAIDEELKHLIEQLSVQKIPYALCGGLAMAVHGFPRATLDIDLIARRGNSGAVLAVARSLGFALAAAPMSFAGGVISIERVTKTIGGRIAAEYSDV